VPEDAEPPAIDPPAIDPATIDAASSTTTSITRDRATWSPLSEPARSLDPHVTADRSGVVHPLAIYVGLTDEPDEFIRAVMADMMDRHQAVPQE
jgi:hypothetical protein